MSLRPRRWGLILLLAGAGLALAQSTAQAQGVDLDTLSEERVEADLDAELDDIYANFDPDSEYDIKDLFPAMINALGDAGDEDDPAEAEITLQQLRDEMAEQGTTLEDEVWAALLEADELAASTRRPALMFSNVAFGADLQDNPRNGKTKPSTATTTAAKRLAGVVGLPPR